MRVNPETMLEGVRKRYAGWVSAMGNSGTQFVKQAVTFFWSDRHSKNHRKFLRYLQPDVRTRTSKPSYDNVGYSSQIPAGFRGDHESFE